jgi:hypothetical protein
MFLVGAARSGTTLLQRLLDAHPQLAVVNETYWVPRRFLERLGLTDEGIVTEALPPMLLESPKFSRMEVSEQDLARLLSEGQPVRYERFVARIFDLYATRRGKRLAGDKTPGYVRRIRQLHELWPGARFVHLIRDPRDLCLSMLDWRSGEKTAGRFGTWETDPVLSTALYWRMSVGVGREAGQALGPGLYHEVRYEDLVAFPDKELERTCEFLSLPYAKAMTRFHEGRMQPEKPGRSSKARWLPPTAGLRDWQAQLDPSDVELIEAAAGDLLTNLGYKSQHERFTQATRERVSAVKATFTQGALALDRALPRDW